MVQQEVILTRVRHANHLEQIIGMFCFSGTKYLLSEQSKSMKAAWIQCQVKVNKLCWRYHINQVLILIIPDDSSVNLELHCLIN